MCCIFLQVVPLQVFSDVCLFGLCIAPPTLHRTSNTSARVYGPHLFTQLREKLAATRTSLAASDSSENQSSSQITHIRDVWVALLLRKYIISYKIISQARQSTSASPRSSCILLCISISEYKPLDKGNWVELSNSRRSMVLMEPENT